MRVRILEEEDFEDEYLGIPRERIPELDRAYMDGLSEKQKLDVIKRWRCVKDFEDGTAVGTILLDNVSVATFNEFRSISKKYFGNSDGPCLAGLVQLFSAEKTKQTVIEGGKT
jgi:hypothetical protein